jgi:hypothetical protein
MSLEEAIRRLEVNLRTNVIPGLSDILKFMTGWVLQWLSAAWTWLGQRRDLLLELPTTSRSLV